MEYRIYYNIVEHYIDNNSYRASSISNTDCIRSETKEELTILINNLIDSFSTDSSNSILLNNYSINGLKLIIDKKFHIPNDEYQELEFTSPILMIDDEDDEFEFEKFNKIFGENLISKTKERIKQKIISLENEEQKRKDKALDSERQEYERLKKKFESN
jgi:hypothetical protein